MTQWAREVVLVREATSRPRRQVARGVRKHITALTSDRQRCRTCWATSCLAGGQGPDGAWPLSVLASWACLLLDLCILLDGLPGLVPLHWEANCPGAGQRRKLSFIYLPKKRPQGDDQQPRGNPRLWIQWQPAWSTSLSCCLGGRNRVSERYHPKEKAK